MQRKAGKGSLQVIQFVMIAAAGGHFGAGLQQLLYQGAADAIGAARYQYHFIVEVRRHSCDLIPQTYFKICQYAAL
jgi:hypothetical protein